MNPQNGYDIEDLSVGMSAEIAKTITDADLVLFAGVSTDVTRSGLQRQGPCQRRRTGVDLNNVKMSINPFCEIAVEEAVRLKD
jgi:hypothetical protein